MGPIEGWAACDEISCNGELGICLNWFLLTLTNFTNTHNFKKNEGNNRQHGNQDSYEISYRHGGYAHHHSASAEYQAREVKYDDCRAMAEAKRHKSMRGVIF